MDQQWAQAIYTASTWVVPVILAITLHEAAHGFVAHWFGDDTAWRLGRVSLNPLKHVDPFGTIVLPGLLLLMRAPFLFGYAKPVPVNFGALKRPRRDMVWVAAAGPAVNLLLATAAALMVHLVGFLPPGGQAWFLENLQNAILINVMLAVFNMIPLPPLDGGRVAVGLLPRRARRAVRPAGAPRHADRHRPAVRSADRGRAARRQSGRPGIAAGAGGRRRHRRHPEGRRHRLSAGEFFRRRRIRTGPSGVPRA